MTFSLVDALCFYSWPLFSMKTETLSWRAKEVLEALFSSHDKDQGTALFHLKVNMVKMARVLLVFLCEVMTIRQRMKPSVFFLKEQRSLYFSTAMNITLFF